MRGLDVNRCCALLAVLLVGAGCGSSGGGPSSSTSSPTTLGPHVASLARIIEATNHVRTFRFSGTSVLPPDSSGHRLTIDITGATDTRTKRTEVVDSSPGESGHEDDIIDGVRLYSRVAGPSSLTSGRWCWFDGKRSPGPGVSLTQTLATLQGSDRQVQYVGTAVVRGDATVHYRVTGGGAPTLDIWVDPADRLRRLRWTHGGDRQTDTTDLFDFDAPVTITVPSDARPCTDYLGTP